MIFTRILLIHTNHNNAIKKSGEHYSMEVCIGDLLELKFAGTNYETNNEQELKKMQFNTFRVT